MIKYIGSKRLLLPAIEQLVDEMPEVGSVLDVFSGTARVGHALKGRGLRVISNDHNRYAATLARCYVEADAESHTDVPALLAELNALPGRAGYFTETFCIKSRYFQPHNGMRIDAIRDAIAAMQTSPEREAVLLTSLMEAADRVDSTTGVQMAYLKSWSARSHNKLELRMPRLHPRVRSGPCKAIEMEAVEAARSTEVDLAYVDPPYNQHRYLGNYHVWETLVRWDAPEVYGVACKRIDCRSRSSAFNSRPRFEEAFGELVHAVRAPRLIVSFSDEGFLPRARAEAILGALGEVVVHTHHYKRYVGAQIGIHNPRGERVGTVSHLRNKEFLYLVRKG